jgi:hypothetical protein
MSDYGIKTSGDDLNWRNLNNDHEDNPVVTALIKEAHKLLLDVNFNDLNINEIIGNTDELSDVHDINDNDEHEVNENEVINNTITDKTKIISEELIIEFNNFLMSNSLGSYFDDYAKLIENEKKSKLNNKSGKNKKQAIKKADLLKMNNEIEKNKKNIDRFITNLKLDENFYPYKKNKLAEAFLNIIFWTTSLARKCKKKETISNEILCDGCISLYRCICDCEFMLNNELKEICYEILNKLEKYLKKRNSNYVHELLSSYYYLITTSYWDKEKPNNIVLYKEQKEAILKIMDSVVNDKPLFLFYWVPPANGKTLISTIIARLIADHFKECQKNKLKYFKGIVQNVYENEEDHEHEDSLCTIQYEDGTIQNNIRFDMIRPLNSNKLRNKMIEKIQVGEQVEAMKIVKPKIMLYICYNDIVRNNVCSLCVTHNVDIKFWLATYRQDKYKSNLFFVDFRPYKSCYPDWRKKKSIKLNKTDESRIEMKFSPNLREQMLIYLDETRPIDIREKELQHHVNFIRENKVEECSNLPEMIISDLDSAYELLLEFPDLFIPYFDEAFAASNQMITSKIMSVLPKTSVLVSATLASPDKIPTILNHFKEKHDANDNHIQAIRTSHQHINCEFVSPDGHLISPFHNLENAEEIDGFLELIEKNPIIERGFSNLIVLKMFENLRSILPETMNLLFVDYIGKITNSNIRNHGKLLLKFCSGNQEYFDKIKKISIQLINDNVIENIFTKNAYFYNNKNTLHVSNPENFSTYVREICSEFLEGSPNLKKLTHDYQRDKKAILDEIENIKENVKADLKDYKLQQANEKLGRIRFNYPNEFIVNSRNHLNKYNRGKKIYDPHSILFNQDIIETFDDLMAKLYLSNIGVYNQDDLSSYELEIFLKTKDLFKFILSDPSIIYGTNINLTAIDIHENLTPISTRNTLYQLIGRGGRFGKSSSAIVIFRSWELFNIVVENSDVNSEATNIENNLIEILNE